MEFLSWYVIFLALGLIFWPITTLLFPSFFDKGYALSKILGLLILGYSMWLFSSLKLLPFNTFSLIVLLGIFLLINTVLAYKKQLTPQLLGSVRIIIFEELLFLGGLIFSLLGLIIWWLGKIALGDMFTALPKAKKVVQTGIYSKIRHPIYVGLSFIFIGWTFLSQNKWILIITLVLILIFISRMKRENKFLEKKFGRCKNFPEKINIIYKEKIKREPERRREES